MVVDNSAEMKRQLSREERGAWGVAQPAQLVQQLSA